MEEREKIERIIRRFSGQRWALIPLLQAVQEAVGYVPPSCFDMVAGHLGLFPSQVQGVVSFYAQFYTEPMGSYVVRVWKGTSCHVRGGRHVLESVRDALGIDEGGTTPDSLFSLETVACLGTCFLSPAMMVGKDYYGLITQRRIPAILDGYRKERRP